MVGKISRCIDSLFVIRYFLRCAPMPAVLGAVHSGTFLCFLFAFSLMLTGCATTQDVKYDPEIRTKFSARSQPAKVSNEDVLSLMKKGYVKIGTVSAKLPETDPTALILEKAATEGGDLVVLYKKDERESEARYERYCKWWGPGPERDEFYCPPGGSCYVRKVRPTECLDWGSKFAGFVHTRHSAGFVWRYEPDLAKQAKQVQIGKEFFLASSRGDAKAVRDGLAQGADVNVRDEKGQTPLMMAAEKGNAEVLKLLLTQGADMNVKARFGQTAVWFAAIRGQTAIAQTLLARGADVNSKNNGGQTSLMLAAAFGHTETVKLLLSRGADVNAKDKNGFTALSEAVASGHAAILQILLANGADVNARDKNGETALTKATRYPKPGVIEILKQAGAKE